MNFIKKFSFNLMNLFIFRYTIKVKRPSFNVTIVMIDTVTLCGNTLADDEGSQPDGKIDKTVESDQLEFIEKTLKETK